METYAELGDFIRSCYGEGSLASSTALAATTQGCTGCMNVTLQLQAPAVHRAMAGRGSAGCGSSRQSQSQYPVAAY